MITSPITICPRAAIPAYEGKRKIEYRTFTGYRFDEGVYTGMHTHASLMDRLLNHFAHSDNIIDLIFKDDSCEPAKRYLIFMKSTDVDGQPPEFVVKAEAASNIPYELWKSRS
jgi:hypothetical protein